MRHPSGSTVLTPEKIDAIPARKYKMREAVEANELFD
jgi:hypothetical protein